MLANTATIYRHAVFVEWKYVILEVRSELVNGRGFRSNFRLFGLLRLLYTHVLLEKSHSEHEKRKQD